MSVNDTKIPTKKNIPASEYKRPPLTVNDKKITAEYQIPASEHKRPTLPAIDTNMPAGEQMPYKKNKRLNGLPMMQHSSFLQLLILEHMLGSIMIIIFIEN